MVHSLGYNGLRHSLTEYVVTLCHRWSFSFAGIYMCILTPPENSQCLKYDVVRHLQQVQTFTCERLSVEFSTGVFESFSNSSLGAPALSPCFSFVGRDLPKLVLRSHKSCYVLCAHTLTTSPHHNNFLTE